MSKLGGLPNRLCARAATDDLAARPGPFWGAGFPDRVRQLHPASSAVLEQPTRRAQHVSENGFQVRAGARAGQEG